MVNGEKIPDGVFINCFTTAVYEAEQAGDTGINFELEGEELLKSIQDAKKDGKSYFDVFMEQALEDSRKFVIQYQIFSKEEKWPSEEAVQEMKKSAESYLSQMFTYYGSSLGAATVQEMAQKGYSMLYDDVIEYFTMSSAIEKFKANLQTDINLSEEEVSEYYAAHTEQFRSVQVRHSLLSTADMDEEKKAQVHEKAKELVEKYHAGSISMDDIVKESNDTDQSGKVNNDGYYTVEASSNFVEPFKNWALKQTEASDTLEIVESTFGYHIMQCTKVSGLEDETVRKNVETSLKAELAEKQAEERTTPYLEKKEYKLKKLNRAYADKLAKRIFTGDFSDVKTSAASASPTAEPTAKPEYNDAPADQTQVVKFGEDVIYKAYYAQFFSQAMNAIYADVDFSAAGDSEEEYFKILNEYAVKEYKDGKTYLETAKERGLELLLDFLTTRSMAAEAGKTLSEEQKLKELEDFDGQLDSMLQYYGATYGVSTRDELLMKMVMANVNDYKPVYLDQLMTSEYANGVIEAMKPETDAVKSFYDAAPDDYRIVTIRHISKTLLDGSGKLLPDAEQAKVLTLMETLRTKIENGDSIEALVEGYSDAADATASKGLVDLKKSSLSIDEKVLDWAFVQTELGKISIIKTESSYELVLIEGLTDYNESKGTVANKTNTSKDAVVNAVTTAYKNDAFEKSVQEYKAQHKFELSDIKTEVIDQIAEAYLKYDGKKEEK